MEEDIKILEDFIKYFEAESTSIKYRRNISITVGEDDIQAIENLIKGYRKLEEINIYLKMCTMDADPLLRLLKSGYIEKKKIREKIEELSKIKGDLATYIAVTEKINVLMELLEEEDE